MRAVLFSLAVFAPLLIVASSGRAQSSGLTTGTLGPAMPDRPGFGSSKATGQPPISYVAKGESDAGRSTIIDLPVHGAHRSDANALKGPMEWVRGEKLQWGYSFPWTGRTPEGRSVPLREGEIVTFLGFAGSNMRMASAAAPDFVVQPPPNITLPMILNFARIKLADCSDVILANRIGKPTTTAKGSLPGETVLVYNAPAMTSAYTQNDPVFVTVPDFDTGTTKQQLVRVPRTVSADYKPYFFEVHCSASGQVTGVEDHLQGQTITYR